MIAIIANPKALRFNVKELIRIKNYLESEGKRTDIFFTKSRGDATTITSAIREYYSIVVAYGGDGTVNEVINGLSGSNTPLGILPAGTTTVIAMELGIPRTPLKAAKLLVRPSIDSVYLGKVSGRLFILMCGVGFDARAVKMTAGKLKSFGKLGYAMGGLKALRCSNNENITFHANGHRYTTTWLVVSKAKKYGAGFNISHLVDVRSKKLDACFTERNGSMGVALAFTGLMLDSHSFISRFGHITTLTVNIETPNIPIQVDGDYIGTTPCRITVHEKPLRVVTP